MENYTTTDFAQFGWRERKIAEELLKASREQGFPDDFYDDEVTIMFNMYSGCVFLANSDHSTAMMNGDKLESWYSCPYCGHEGFAENMDHDPVDTDCTEYLQDIGVIDKEESND